MDALFAKLKIGGRAKKTAATRKVKPTRKTIGAKDALDPTKRFFKVRREVEQSKRDAEAASTSPRLQRFNQCMKGEVTVDPLGQQRLRVKASGLNGIRYGFKMNDHQLAAMWRHLMKIGYETVDDVFTRTGLEACHDVLCRWPRPSELGRLAKMQGESLEYWLCEVPLVEDTSVAKFVGKQGVHLIRLCEEYDLLYAWVKDDKLFIYARTEVEAVEPTLPRRGGPPSHTSKHMMEFIGGQETKVTKIVLGPRSTFVGMDES